MTSDFRFSQYPGRHERQLQRRHYNLLFYYPSQPVTEDEVSTAQRVDHEEVQEFIASLQALVQQIAKLPANVGSDTVLDLKEQLERHYEQACGLAEDQTHHKTVIRRLIEMIMSAISQRAAHDPIACQELHDEAVARQLHFQLLEHPLIVDLLDPKSMIMPAELAATLLSAELPQLEAAMELFDGEQLAQLVNKSEALLMQRHQQGLSTSQLSAPNQRLAILKQRLEQDQPSVDNYSPPLVT